MKINCLPSSMRTLVSWRFDASELFKVHVYKGSCSSTSMSVTIVCLFCRSTSIVFSQECRKIPSTPETPNPAIISRVKRNGIVSGVGRHLPCSNAMPKSIWINSAVLTSMRMLLMCRSPIPRIYPMIEVVAKLCA